PALEQVFASGWQPVTYRQNTELAMEAWHWNPQGTWSDPSGKGYFTGSTTPTEIIRYSYGYSLPHRGTTRCIKWWIAFASRGRTPMLLVTWCSIGRGTIRSRLKPKGCGKHFHTAP